MRLKDIKDFKELKAFLETDDFYEVCEDAVRRISNRCDNESYAYITLEDGSLSIGTKEVSFLADNTFDNRLEAEICANENKIAYLEANLANLQKKLQEAKEKQQKLAITTTQNNTPNN